MALAACGGGGGGSGGGGGGGDDAAGFPECDITFIVPFSAGGPTDTVTRLIADPMSKELGTSIIVQNVEGASGTIAAGQVAAADPDAYTVLMHAAPDQEVLRLAVSSRGVDGRHPRA